MKITRLKRRYCHYDDKKEFCRYKLKDIHFSLKNRKQSYLTSAGILDGSHTYTGPTVVQIDVTNRCNNNCMVCWLRSPLLEELEATSEWQSKELPLKVVIKLLD